MKDDPIHWEREEWQSIHQRREKAFQTPPPKDVRERPKNLIGLALSGGGIRSALYNDGFLQGLSHRGFLRFVDYLASVSGGGYIAGHLIAQAERFDESNDDSANGPANHSANDPTRDRNATNFHDDDETKRWHLGRDPATGKLDPDRLAAVGGYLSRPMEVLPAYLWSCFFSAAFYVGICGVLATLAALFWRSFDDPTFRILYLEVLGIRVGNELLIAFIPAMAFLMLFVAVEICFAALRWAFGRDKWNLQGKHIKIRAWSFVALVLACLTSIAIFLGNGTTNIHAAASGSIFLNHYAQWLAVIAGTLQVLVFFGSDRLFRSERQEAKSWQKHVQQFVAVGVTMFLVFSMIHWMGRENISQYTNHRAPDLVRGDVSDWQTLENVFALHGASSDEQTHAQNVADTLPSELRLRDPWQQTLATRRWGWLSHIPTQTRLGTDSQSESPTEPSPWMLEQRLLGAFYAYQLALSDDPSSATGRSTKLPEPEELKRTSVDQSQGGTVAATMRRRFDDLKTLQSIQNERLDDWNQKLKTPEFTKSLLTGFSTVPTAVPTADPTLPTNSSTGNLPNPVYKEIRAFLGSDDFEFSNSQKNAIANAAHRIALTKSYESDAPSATDQSSYANVNRLLLEALFPAAIRPKDIPSTYVVPPYDQQARRSWLGFWLLLATVGAIGGVYRHQVATVFRFYRRQLGSNFLVPSHLRNESLEEVQLYQLDPTADGLPYPLLLAASLQPATVNGGYTIDSRTFMFTPRYCGDLDDSNNRICTKQVALSKNDTAKAVTLADAVTLSGAAVTAFMTTNRCLSLLVDFFNTGLGMQVYRTEKTDIKSIRPGNLGWLVVAGISAAFAWLIHWVSRADWPSTLTAFGLAWIIGSCVIHEKGVPHFLKMLLLPREVGPDAPKRLRERSAKSFYVADGGFTDYLGVSALLKRRCQLIVVSDAGANVGDNHLGTLAKMCEKTSAEMGIRFVDLDHEAPIDFGRLLLDEQRLVHQPYICMRVRYPDATEGLLIYCQMAISESDPIEIQQIRHRFPTFPDEPTVNQFYTEEQVSAYRMLGYHVASKLCRELERWCFNRQGAEESDEQSTTSDGEQTHAHVDSTTPEFKRFLHALQKPSLASAAQGDGSVPYFHVLQERLLTAYRLACYEEVSYRKDDILNEAIWRMRTYAFPNLLKHIRSLSLQFDPHEFAESWLRLYELSADIRSVYRKAVLEDINVMDTEAQSYCAALYTQFAAEKDVKLNCRQLLSAHLTALATACQEVHRGRPHAAFQIGGRQKLIQLCENIAGTIATSLSQPTSSSPDLHLREVLGNVVAEISELERSVFQGSEHVTTISFAQCVCVMWGRFARTNQSRVEGIDGVAERGRLAFKSGRKTPTESRMVAARHELDRGLRQIQLERILDTLTRLWYLGYFNSDAGEMLNERTYEGFGFSGFKRSVKAMVQSEIANRARIWLRQCDSQNQLRRAYVNAIDMDSEQLTSDEDSQVAALWYDLLNTAKAIRPDISVEQLLTAHLAALATSYVRYAKAGPQIAEVQFAAGGRQHLLEVCRRIADLIVDSMDPENPIAADFWDLNTILEKLSGELRKLDESKVMRWTPSAIGQFARSVISVWSTSIRNDHFIELLSDHADKAEHATEELKNQMASLAPEKFSIAYDEQLAHQIRSDDPKAVLVLMQLWYHALVRRNNNRRGNRDEQTVAMPAAKNGKPKKSSKKKTTRKTLR